MTERFYEVAHRVLHYLLSLPERTIRSLAALAGGTSLLLTDLLFPEAVRGTTTYQVTIALLQRFVIEQVAGMSGGSDARQWDVTDDFVRRKMAGTALEAAGLLTMSMSPVWVMAIAADAAGGSKLFLKRLVARLKENGVIDATVDATELVDVLEAIQSTARQSAAAIDMPPLKREELVQLADEMRASYGQIFSRTYRLVPRLEQIWQEMRQLSRQEDLPMEYISGVMTVDAARQRSTRSRALATAGRAAVELVDENILHSYRDTLAAIAQQGLGRYASQQMQPFVRSALSHYDPARHSWTEQKINERRRQ